MKKILLGTTGLVAVAFIATAASAETPKVTLGGFSDFQSGWTNDDTTLSQRSHGFRNDNEIVVKVDGKTDGGLGYGAQIDLEADTTADANNQGVNASRTFTYLDSKFGRVELGGNRSVASTMRVDASTVATATGGINGAWVFFANPSNVNAITTSKLVSEHGNQSTFGDESTYNATKISYYTPKFAGFQAGVSYTPSLDDRGQRVARNDAAGVNDVFDFGLGYEGTFSGVKLAASGTYEFGEGQGAAIANTATTTFSGLGSDDVESWNVGALVGYKGFSLAGSYGDWIDSGIAGQDGDYWTLGGAYAAGPVGVSATYLDSNLGGNDFQNLVLGAEYKLAAGLTPYAEVSFFDLSQPGAANDNDGTVFILGTQVAF